MSNEIERQIDQLVEQPEDNFGDADFGPPEPPPDARGIQYGDTVQSAIVFDEDNDVVLRLSTDGAGNWLLVNTVTGDTAERIEARYAAEWIDGSLESCEKNMEALRELRAFVRI